MYYSDIAHYELIKAQIMISCQYNNNAAIALDKP